MRKKDRMPIVVEKILHGARFRNYTLSKWIKFHGVRVRLWTPDDPTVETIPAAKLDYFGSWTVYLPTTPVTSATGVGDGSPKWDGLSAGRNGADTWLRDQLRDNGGEFVE